MLNSAENTIERLFFLLSHELRTPITALQGTVDLLRMHQLHEKLEVDLLLTLAAENTERLTRVVEDILTWYEITHSATLFRQCCDIAALIQRVVDGWQSFAMDRQIQVRLDLPAQILSSVDEYHLSRAFSHLVHNAIKFSQPQHWVVITAEAIFASDPLARPDLPLARPDLPLDLPLALVTIRDEGIGIPEADLEKVFQPFYQVDTSDARSYGGLGLELAICQQVIEHHQGKIWAESQLGQGSTFYVALPIELPQSV